MRSSGPDITVLVTTYLGVGWVGRCLRSLGAQDLDSEQFEVVLVHRGPADGTAAAVAAVRSEYPALRLRYLTADVPTAGAAAELGLAAASGRWLTLVGEEDAVAPGFLSGLHEQAQAAESDQRDAALVALALLVDITAGRAAVDFRAPRLGRIVPKAGSTVPLAEAPAALGYAPAKLVLTRVARSVGFDADVDLGFGTVFWARLAVAVPLHLAICPIASHAVYYRTVTRNPQLPAVVATGLVDAIDRIASLPMETDALRSARSWMLVELTDAIRRYLITHPDHHRAVIHELRRRNLTDVQLARLNHGVARDLAVLYTAVPFVDTSANVAARRILDRETIVDVVSSDMSRDLRVDESAHLVWAEFVDEIFQTDTLPAVVWWPGIVAFCRKGLAHIKANEKRKGPYRSVYSRTMHPASHLLAAWYKIRNPHVRWIAEFSDPILHNIHGLERESSGRVDPQLLAEFGQALAGRGVTPPADDNMFRWIETLTYALADELVFTNENQFAYMAEHFADRALVERLRERAVVAKHPTLPQRFYELVPSTYELDPDAVNLAYFGVFYATRGLTEVVDALRTSPPEVRRRLRLHVFTNKPEELAAEAGALGLDDVIVANGFVDFLEYLNLATRFDVLIVNDARTLDTHDRNPYLPSKLSDYLGSGRPIWAVFEPGSVLSAQTVAYRSPLGDVAAARAVLARVVEASTVPAVPA